MLKNVYVNKKKLLTIIILLLVAIFYYFIVTKTSLSIKCPLSFFNIKCPGCGITRMYVHMLSGKFSNAIKDNAVIFIYQPLIYYLIFKNLFLYIQDKPFILNKIEKILSYILLFSLLIFGIIRNFFF